MTTAMRADALVALPFVPLMPLAIVIALATGALATGALATGALAGCSPAPAPAPAPSPPVSSAASDVGDGSDVDARAGSSNDVDARAASERWRADVERWTYPEPLPSTLPLVDHEGRRFMLGELAGAPLAIGFVFTRCPVANACPLTMTKLGELERAASATTTPSAKSKLRILVVTIDPDHDTPAVLSEYRARHGVQFMLATGERDVVDALASMFNVVALRRNASEGDIDHPVKVALLDEKLAPVRVWSDNNFTPIEIVDASAPQ